MAFFLSLSLKEINLKAHDNKMAKNGVTKEKLKLDNTSKSR